MGGASGSGALGLFYSPRSEEVDSVIVRHGATGWQVCILEGEGRGRRYQIVAELLTEDLARKLASVIQ